MVRRLGWTRSTLRRGSDRLEGWLNAVLILVFLVVGTALAGHTARTTYRDELRAAASERAHRHQVWALLLEPPAPDIARARWTGPDLSAHVGQVVVPPTAAAGSWLLLWVDDRGEVTSPPSRRRPATDATEVAVAVVLVLAAALAALRLVARHLLDRRRLRSWQEEWTEVGPRWSRYR